MRKLVILRGAMGSGKSTFIKKHKLEKYTISSDILRLMLNAPELSINYNEQIPQFNNKKVWDLLYYLLEERMKKGEFTIIDAVHAKYDESLTKYKKLAFKYRYRLYILDFTDIPKEEVYKRNLMREEYKVVPTKSIDRVYEIFAKEQIPSTFKIIKPDQFNDIFNSFPISFDKYNKVHIFGDIHGCFTPLNTFFKENPFSKEEAYIFTGDYFDRGIENLKVFNFLNELSNNDNVYLLVGNHEDKLYKYACDDEFNMDYDIKNTIKELENNITKSELRGFIKKLSQILYISYNNKIYLINHGGIPYFPKKSLDFYSTNSFIYGVDKYETNIDEIYNNYMVKKRNKIYQIHGHRNINNIKYNMYKFSINLDGNIENGGYLRILTLNKNKDYSYKEIQNNVYNNNLLEENSVYNLINDLRKNKYIYEKKLDNNISSFNFSKEAFYNKIWDNMTTKARGLFIDTKNNKIIARSYNKFFNINERKETKIENIFNTIKFPVNFYLKYNGFLGILSSKDGELFFASKSTNEGIYVDYFKKIFFQKFNKEQVNTIKEKIIKDNVTFVFEVIDKDNDPHIIEYKSNDLILLDIIFNKTIYNKLSFNELMLFAKENNIKIKELIYTANNTEEFINVYNIINDNNYKLNNEYIEGFVIEDNNNFMIKIKSKYYNKWKYLRTLVEKGLKNNNYNLDDLDEDEKKFLMYIKNKYQNIDKINIIKERNEFEKTNNN